MGYSLIIFHLVCTICCLSFNIWCTILPYPFCGDFLVTNFVFVEHTLMVRVSPYSQSTCNLFVCFSPNGTATLCHLHMGYCSVVYIPYNEYYSISRAWGECIIHHIIPKHHVNRAAKQSLQDSAAHTKLSHNACTYC